MVESLNQNDKPVVVITGVTGLLGSYVCLTFLQSQRYQVRGTVRNPNDLAKLEPLKKGLGEDLFNQLELVSADLLNAESIMTACSGADYIVHTASPVAIDPPKDESIMIRPAVDGTLAVMEAARVHKVKRVVITSSVDAIFCSDEDPELYDESYWSDLNHELADAYVKSKTIAERSAWDFVKILPEDEKFGLSVINPSFIFGPALSGGKTGCVELFRQIIMNECAGIPKMSFPVCDIRNVAEAHLRALESDEAQGNRFILCAGSLWFKDIARILHEDLDQEYKYNIKHKEMWKFTLKIAALVDNEAAVALKLWGIDFDKLNNQKSKDILGIDYLDIEQAVRDMGRSLIETGVVPKKLRNKK